MTMTRTRIELDDRLLRIIMERHQIKSKSYAVNLALRNLADEVTPMTREEVLAMQGSNFLDEDPDEMMSAARK